MGGSGHAPADALVRGDPAMPGASTPSPWPGWAGGPVPGSAPLGVVAPESAEALAAVLRECSAADWPVLPAGAGTWLHAAARWLVTDETRPPLIVTTARLASVIEHEPADLVVGVQAGMALEDLHRHLATAGQWLPLDPPADARATVGAVIALGGNGPLRAGYGLPRDMVLGLEVATGDGRLLRFGGRVVKNVAGYDGVRLVTGSGGGLGIITAVYLRVRGMRGTIRTWVLPADDPAAAVRTALTVRDAMRCEALEVVSPPAAGRAPAAASAPAAGTSTAASHGAAAGGQRWKVLVRLPDAAADVAVLERLGGAALEPAGAAAVWRRLRDAEAEAGMYAMAERRGCWRASTADSA
jgi:glycolate oxidase FAD binding subunit